MKTALSIIGIVFLVLLVVVGGAVGFICYKGYQLDASSKAYVDDNIHPIIDHWSKDELVKRESDQFRAATTDEQLTKLFEAFSRLGSLKSYEGAKGAAAVNATPGSGVVVTATYVAMADFDNGKAQIKVTLIQVKGDWQIMGFRVDSPLFVK